MSKIRRAQTHARAVTFEDPALWGRAVYRTRCSCGYETRGCTTPEVSVGLWRRHTVLAGRGYAQHQNGI